MSSSSPTTSGSRSPSPHTPDPSEHSDPVTVQAEIDGVHSWFIPMQRNWETEGLFAQRPSEKVEEAEMLRIDDVLEQHAFDDPPVQPLFARDPPPTTAQPSHFVPNFRPTNILVPSHNGPISVTKPIPPPASLPRKLDPVTHNHHVVYPPKESCFNLPIVFPSIPEGGTKSRVETQVRVTVDLADATSSSETHKYNRVGSWKWLKLPPGTSTKRRTRKQGKIEASPPDTLKLITEVVCASAPTIPVVSCSSCRTREAKRVAKKIAARVRPARSDSESAGEDTFGKPIRKPVHEDTNSIIQFNCAEVLDFSTGSVVLPLRITCYCRHHREKVGFLVRFTMMDHVGRVIGTGTSRPIMITDDHKTASASARQTDCVATFSPTEPDWPRQLSPIATDATSSPQDLRGPSRRKDKTNGTMLKRRPKPYDAPAKLGRGSREGSVSSLPSPSTAHSPLPTTRSPTPSVLQNLLTASDAVSQLPSQFQTPPNMPALQSSIQSSDTSSPDLLSTPLDHNSDMHMPEIIPQIEQQSLAMLHQSIPTPLILQQPQPQVLSPVPQPTPAMMLSQQANPSASTPITGHPIPFFLFESNHQTGPSLAAMQMPTIHRLIPNMGPTYGGIEVTVLGANFHANLNLRCIFGEVVASSTQRWSDNTLVCVLPPRAQPGVVAVWFEGMIEHPNTPPSLFTYSDESDRALMELALQVVGLKMTGKIEDAKNVAMRIVGGGGNTGLDGQNSQNGNGASSLMQLSLSTTSSSNVSSTTPQSTPTTTYNRDLRSLLYIRAGETENFESTVINFLSILDTPLDTRSAPSSIPTSSAVSHTTSTGQTLLHLAAFMKLPALVNFLVQHDADIDARDKNGFTPLHFAVLADCEDCVRVLINAGVDREIVNARGQRAEEIALSGLFEGIICGSSGITESNGEDGDVESEVDDLHSQDKDEEAEWGDAEEEEDGRDGDGEDANGVKFRKLLKRRASKFKRGALSKRSIVNSVNASGRGTPHRSLDVSRAATPPLRPSSVPPASQSPTKPDDTTSTTPSIPPSSEKSSSGTQQADSKLQPTPYIFVDRIQRTLAQFPLSPTTLLPKPQLPAGLLGLPNLSELNLSMSNMPGWGALPQIPMVFPVFVPMPAWPSFRLGGKEEGGVQTTTKERKGAGDGKKDGENVSQGDEVGVGVTGGESEGTADTTDGGKAAATNAREWRAMWEKWLALAIATTAVKQQVDQVQQVVEDVPPPEYTPRAEAICPPIDQKAQSTMTTEKGKGKAKATPLTSTGPVDVTDIVLRGAPSTTTREENKEIRGADALQPAAAAAAAGSSKSHNHNNHPVGYDDTPVPVEEVEAYAYQLPVKQKQKQKHKKHDRMLLVFWLPILLLSMIWAFHNGLRFAYTTLRAALPLRAYLRGNA